MNIFYNANLCYKHFIIGINIDNESFTIDLLKLYKNICKRGYFIRRGRSRKNEQRHPLPVSYKFVSIRFFIDIILKYFIKQSHFSFSSWNIHLQNSAAYHFVVFKMFNVKFNHPKTQSVSYLWTEVLFTIVHWVVGL